jgi:hypothetical protein
MKSLTTTVIAAGATLFCSAVFASPVEYVRVCSSFGAGFEFVPGTDTCVNVLTGETRRNTDHGVVSGTADFVKDASEGTALGMALEGAVIDPGKTHGVAVNVGTFNGETAFGLGAAMQVGNGISVSGAYGIGAHRGASGGRAGLNYSW